jgi:hypothetical protein
MSVSMLAEQGRMVVVRFLDGRTLKGTTQDFAPNKTQFHVYEGGDESSRAVAVDTASLKAVFFVKSYEGDSVHQDRHDFESAVAHGRKMLVRFLDGEEIAGTTTGYNPAKPGFFLIPADADCNNARIFVVSSAVAAVEWV